jgi:predicted kinase
MRSIPDAFMFPGIAARHHVNLVLVRSKPNRRGNPDATLSEGCEAYVFLAVKLVGNSHADILTSLLSVEPSATSADRLGTFHADTLPAGPWVCYKPEMRKWMSERLKRRKKEPEKAGAEPAPAPLQPAFYDTQPAPEEPPAERNQPRSTPLQPEAAHDLAPSEPQAANPRQAGNADVTKRRRRRGRGGRGRGRNGSSAAQSVTGSEPSISTQPAPHETAPLPSAHGASAPSQPEKPTQPSKGVVVLAIGLPGSGKSSWFKRHDITPLSSDMLRALLFDDPTEQRFQDLIFSNLRSMLKARLIARRPMNYVDATNLTPHERNGWVKLAKDYGYEVQAVFFDVPVEVCLERNRRRERKVPEDAMRRMAGKLKQPTFEEGFSKITVVRVKQKE